MECAPLCFQNNNRGNKSAALQPLQALKCLPLKENSIEDWSGPSRCAMMTWYAACPRLSEKKKNTLYLSQNIFRHSYSITVGLDIKTRTGRNLVCFPCPTLNIILKLNGNETKHHNLGTQQLQCESDAWIIVKRSVNAVHHGDRRGSHLCRGLCPFKSQTGLSCQSCC